ncbi:hypothetical protein KM92DES2_11994 [uncultured Desulfovibrio sp.]|uniref:Uncharacterized protein n=1 Tax=uncultured Desulfovibrio sp. TaxID=167968 RepID=A0A212JZW2_9BACT|nr:hypothetical protein KM92DES2_11994 [uncultured Desulfovibrio sp.]
MVQVQPWAQARGEARSDGRKRQRCKGQTEEAINGMGAAAPAQNNSIFWARGAATRGGCHGHTGKNV